MNFNFLFTEKVFSRMISFQILEQLHLIEAIPGIILKYVRFKKTFCTWDKIIMAGIPAALGPPQSSVQSQLRPRNSLVGIPSKIANSTGKLVN